MMQFFTMSWRASSNCYFVKERVMRRDCYHFLCKVLERRSVQKEHFEKSHSKRPPPPPPPCEMSFLGKRKNMALIILSGEFMSSTKAQLNIDKKLIVGSKYRCLAEIKRALSNFSKTARAGTNKSTLLSKDFHSTAY